MIKAGRFTLHPAVCGKTVEHRRQQSVKRIIEHIRLHLYTSCTFVCGNDSR